MHEILTRSNAIRSIVLLFAVIALFGLGPSLAQRERAGASVDDAGNVTRASVDSLGDEAKGPSTEADIAAGGRYVAFTSAADNLVENDLNQMPDVFVHDLVTGETTRVSIASDGLQANGPSGAPSISADGRFVAFYSEADNLVGDDDNGEGDVFVRDRETKETFRVSVSSGGGEGTGKSSEPAISDDGRFVAFRSAAPNLVASDLNDADDVFVHSLETHATILASVGNNGVQGNAASEHPAISADGGIVAFLSYSRYLVSGDTNGKPDIFVRDLDAMTTTRASVSSEGVQANKASYHVSISGDGNLVAFDSSAENLTPGDTNEKIDIFVRDLAASVTTRVSVNNAGEQADDDSFQPRISANGRFVAFWSNANNLVPGGASNSPHVFLADLAPQSVARVSVNESGDPANDFSLNPSVSGDGSLVAYESFALNLVPDDKNVTWDIFVYEALGQLSGTVLDKASNDPLPGVAVSAGYGRTVFTDAEGNYVIDNVLPGTYNLTASLAGYAFDPAVRQVSVPPSSSGLGFLATASDTFALSGKIIDGATNEPLAGVVVSDGNGRTAATDDQGIYTLSGLPGGSYTLTPSKPGYTFNPPSRLATVPPDGQALNFAGYTTYHIYGKVTNAATGNPITGVTISAGGGIVTTTDSEGVYQLSGLAPAIYTLTASKAGLTFTPPSRVVTVPPNADEQDFVVGQPPPSYRLYLPAAIR